MNLCSGFCLPFVIFLTFSSLRLYRRQLAQGLDAGLSPNDTIPCNNPEAAGGGMDHFLSSQWHLEHANCLKRKHDDDHLNDENAGDGGSHDRSSHGSGGGSGGDTVNRTRRNHDREEQQFCPLGRRFLHIGRTTAHVDSSAAAVFAEEHPEWLVVSPKKRAVQE